MHPSNTCFSWNAMNSKDMYASAGCLKVEKINYCTHGVISMAGRSKLQYKEAENEIWYLVLHWAEIKVAIHKAGLVLSFRLYYIKICSRYSQEDKKRSGVWSIQLKIVSHMLNPTYFNILSLSQEAQKQGSNVALCQMTLNYTFCIPNTSYYH